MVSLSKKKTNFDLRIIKTISYERRAYKSVDEKSILGYMN